LRAFSVRRDRLGWEFLALNVVAGLLLVTEGRGLLKTLFEATSAFGTVGRRSARPARPSVWPATSPRPAGCSSS
jgi:hypothetical protein